ncbi:Glycolate dehydrogenase, subunit GlcD [hydrothermal vent metagenome]|uniref:Glycolate dehydrogenase, subunit GlcD n=1 Tax=hydrothermal vent metagenome TaxID=652676 RepID=A0A3B1B1B5_9ZZZZ
MIELDTIPQATISKAALIEQLSLIIPANDILFEAEDLRPYECDGLSAYRALPMLVVIPNNIEEIQAIVKLCQQYSVPIIARGAGTGLSGGTFPFDTALVLNMAKLNRILNIDSLSATARVEPGVRNLAISEAVFDLGLYYAPDPSSQVACTIGGNVAENSGGIHCLKYGLTVHNIIELKIVLYDGTLVTVGSEAYDSPGYDLLALLTGSEGLLAIIVEVTVKLLTKPEFSCVLLAAFDSVQDSGNAVNQIISAGIIPAGLEMMDKLAIKAAEDFIHAGYPTDAQAILLCELDGTQDEVQDLTLAVQKILNSHKATQITISKTEQQRLKLWQGRKSAFPAVGRLAPDYYCMDGTIPRSQLSQVLTTIQALSKQYNLAVANVFHAGDGNLHPLILYDANIAGELEKTEQFGAKILELCIDVGGTITGEHGVGIEKINQMCVQFNCAELNQFHAIKYAFDPDNILNPGKAVPTLHRCAELGSMHVHNGKLKHPELERF